MKYLLPFFLGLVITLSVAGQDLPTMRYEVDVTQNLDTFFVSLTLDKKLDQTDTLFQFPATAPGTYQTMNIGRFVSDLTAFDGKGKPIDVSRTSVNQFVIHDPGKVGAIRYKVAETFDTRVKEYPIYLMCGSSIEEDHTLINPHTVLGYFGRLQRGPFRLKVTGEPDWKTGTALTMDEDGYYLAQNYDHLVDSPMLMGKLSYADTMIANTRVEVYTYSANGKMESGILLRDMADMLDAAREFLIELPVDHYTFLYFFEPDQGGRTGAWEHSYSSAYVLQETDPTPEQMKRIMEIASHEFFHIVTPLNIHSEIIESFNFMEPTPSVHLWMYEGVTEWASDILLYRGGVVDLLDYLDNGIADKVLIDEKYFDNTWSLEKLANESFKGGEGASQYGNIYYRGALVAGLLDIRLLELSDGVYGLRELILDLVEKYGKGRPVSEAAFFDDITEMTYPEIRDFFDRYVLDAQPLPLREYYQKIGLRFERTKSGVPVVKKMKEMTPEQEKRFRSWSQNLPR